MMTTRLTSNSPRQEAIRQKLILDRADRRFSKRFARIIAKAMRQMIAEYRVTRALPNPTLDHEREVQDQFLDLAGSMAQVFGGRILEQGKASGLALEHKAGWAEFFQQVALAYIENEMIRARIVSITNTTRRNVVRLIQLGQREGLGVDEIAGNLAKQVPGISKWRGALIARTETHGAANHAAHASAKATGLKLRKEWVSVEDARTRDFGEGDGVVDEYNHRAMDGQIVEMDDPFIMPRAKGESIRCMFPGDPTLPPGASINCRCAISHIVDRG